MQPGRGDVLMVGSLPFDTVEEAFRSVGGGLAATPPAYLTARSARGPHGWAS